MMNALAQTDLETLGPIALRLLAEMDGALDQDARARHSLRQLQALLRILPGGADQANDDRPGEPGSASPPAQGGLAPWQIKQVTAFVGANLDQRILVEHLADRARLSTSHFCRAFKITTGETPHAYVMRRRLERAQMLIQETNESLGQIADACGLSDQAHMTRLFRRYLGITPHQWRRRRASPMAL